MPHRGAPGTPNAYYGDTSITGSATDGTKFWNIWCAALGTDGRPTAVTGDFNLDGRADIALVGVRTTGTVPVALSRGDGTVTTAAARMADFNGWSRQPGVRTITGDFDRDGRTDIALLPGPGTPWWTSIPVAFAVGDGTFRVTNVPSPAFAGNWAQVPGAQVVSGDFNHDGRTDIALAGGANWTAIPVAFSNGDGSFTVTTAASPNFAAWAYTPYGARLWAGDFNHDGRTDLALTSAGYFTTIPVAFSNGDGTFTVTNADSHGFEGLALASGAQMVTGDFNHDGNTDFALAGGLAWSTIPVAFSTGDGGFRITNAPSADFAGLAQPRYVHVPDVGGQTLDQASATLATFGLSVNHPFLTAADPTCNNIGAVVAESPAVGGWIDTATAVTITLGQQPFTTCR